jgi:hypothetical protein
VGATHVFEMSKVTNPERVEMKFEGDKNFHGCRRKLLAAAGSPLLEFSPTTFKFIGI